MAFAEVSDLEAVIEARLGRELTADEQSRAEVLLGDASAMLTAYVGNATPEKLDLLKMVSCNMVFRVMCVDSADSFGVDSTSITAGPYSQTLNYSNPAGDMYLTKSERIMLGITGGYIGTIRPMMAGEHGA